MFNGSSNYEMLKLMMEMKGKVNSKMIKKGSASHKYFDEQGRFFVKTKDPVTGLETVKT